MNHEPPHSVVMAVGPARNDELQQLLDEERANDGARARRDRFWLGRIEEEAMTLPGLLIAVAESGIRANLTLLGGRTHHGRITAVGADLFALQISNGTKVLVPLARVLSVRTTDRQLIAVDREPSSATFRGELLALSEQRAEVRLGFDGGIDACGILVACGAGVVALRTANGELAYLAEQHIAEIVIVAPPGSPGSPGTRGFAQNSSSTAIFASGYRCSRVPGAIRDASMNASTSCSRNRYTRPNL